MKECAINFIKTIKNAKKYFGVALLEVYFIFYCLWILPYLKNHFNTNINYEIKIYISFLAIGFAIYNFSLWREYKKNYRNNSNNIEKYKLGKFIFRFIHLFSFLLLTEGISLLLKLFRIDDIGIIEALRYIGIAGFPIFISLDVMNITCGTNWDVVLFILIVVLFISLKNDKLITALIPYGIIKLIDWLSSSDSLYYFVNPHAELSVSDLESVNFQIKRKWMIQKANALFIVICVGLTYGIREMIPGELLRSFVHSIVDWLVTIKFFTGDGDINLRKNFAESMILVVIFFMLTVLIKYIILKKKWDIPYLKAMVESQINIAKNIEKESSRKTKRNKIRSRFIKYRR